MIQSGLCAERVFATIWFAVVYWRSLITPDKTNLDPQEQNSEFFFDSLHGTDIRCKPYLILLKQRSTITIQRPAAIIYWQRNKIFSWIKPFKIRHHKTRRIRDTTNRISKHAYKDSSETVISVVVIRSRYRHKSNNIWRTKSIHHFLRWQIHYPKDFDIFPTVAIHGAVLLTLVYMAVHPRNLRSIVFQKKTGTNQMLILSLPNTNQQGKFNFFHADR